MKGSEARKLFIDYFKKHNHRHVRSSSLVPSDDPTLLFVNAGMVQFKRTFIGEEKRDYSTAVTSQKCVRAGGKHNDLENVGYTARHHTFFEMLGNFSFGDYFKTQAISFAWDLLTNGYGLPVDKLWVSIYLDDDEAFEIWHNQMGVPKERIVRLGEADNFWSMGDTGPCGPCTEIHIDRGERFGCDRPDCAVYDTDLFTPIIGKVEALSGKKMADSNDTAIAMKVIADHSRAATFLISDGVMPSNEGRGYVLRRIMRRAIRYGRFIGLTEPFLHDTSRVVMEMMGDVYPELKESEAFITNVIKNEEESFSVTLDNGLRLLEEALDDLTASDEKVLSGEVIFRLYDTFGFPVDIIRDVISDDSIVLDMDGFDTAMDAQREKSRSNITFARSGEAFRKLSAEGVKTEFIGYAGLTGESKILVVAVDGVEVDAPALGTEVEVVVESTPFYGESGGQMGDSGTISGEGFSLTVTDTIKDPTGIFIHKCRVESGIVKAGLMATLAVDGEKRAATALNHTATHILHTALRTVLGDHVKQAGSLVGPERLRFDFTHFAHVDRATLDAIETFVNTHIRMNVPVSVEEMDAEAAMKTGATALFEEKYGDRIRVVTMGDFSKEFCGGTHTAASGDIGTFRILSDSGIASGVRRIEALTGATATSNTQKSVNALADISAMVKTTPDHLGERLEKLLVDNKTLEKELKQLKMQMAGKAAESLDDDIKEVNGIRAVAKKVAVEDPSQLRELADRFRDKIGSGVVLLGTESGGKALLLALVTKDLTKTYKAGDIVKKAAALVGGGGGGRPDMAQAGGSKPEHLDAALASLFDYLGNQS